MSEAVRLYQYRSLLNDRVAVSATQLAQRLEISPATLKRDLAKLRDQLHVPIRYDRDQGGYLLDKASGNAELPGLWFNQDEILALVTIQQLLTQLEPGLLGDKLRPLQDRLGELMEKHGLTSRDIAKRIRIVHAGKRRVKAKEFEAVAAATVARKRLKIHHYNRQSGQTVEREVSPQRLVHYRDNWYLDAWCHLRDALRSFSVDAIEHAQRLDAPAIEMDEAALDDELGAGYGIYAGSELRHAVLRFSAASARWVAAERWHPNQIGRRDADGRWLLTVPYSDPRELVMDVLRHVPEVEVLATDELRHEVVQRLRQGLRTMGLDE